MKWLKKCGIIIITIIIFNTIFSVQANSDRFSDVKDSDWFYKNLNEAVGKGIISGYSDGTFKANDNMRVDEFIKTVVVAINGSDLADDGKYWFERYAVKASEFGLLENLDIDNFTDNITREQMAVICEHAINYLEPNTRYSQLDKIEASITDANAIDSSKKDAVYKVYELGVITGYPNHTYKPLSFLKRSEALTVTLRVIDASERVPWVEPSVVVIPNMPPEIYSRLMSYPFNTPDGKNNNEWLIETMEERVTDPEDKYLFGVFPEEMPDYVYEEIIDFITLDTNFDYRTTNREKYIAEYRRYSCPASTVNGVDMKKTINNYVDSLYKNKIVVESEIFTDKSLLYYDVTTGKDVLRVTIRYYSKSDNSGTYTVGKTMERDMDIYFGTESGPAEKMKLWETYRKTFNRERKLGEDIEMK